MFSFKLVQRHVPRLCRSLSEKIKGGKVRPGMALALEDVPHKVTKMTQGKKGKGGGFVKTQLKNMITGQSYEKTFTSDEIVELAGLEREPFQYSWTDGENYTFLHTETFEEMQVAYEDVDDRDYLIEGREVMLTKFRDRVIGVELPKTDDYEVVKVDYDREHGGYHYVTLDSGAELLVPDFIGVGTRVKVNIPDRTYIERVNA